MLFRSFLPAYNYYGEKTASGYVNNFDYGDDEDDDFLGSFSVASSGKSLGRK